LTAGADGRLRGAGGLSIYWQRWLPEAAPSALVVIAHGVSEHSDRYRHVGARLVAAGYAAYAIDHRGHGRSEGKRALVDRIDNAVADLDALVVLAAEQHPGVPVFLLGHSMGGAIALCYAIAHQDRLSGLLLSGPVAALEAAPPSTRMLAAVLSALTPGLPLIEIDAGAVSRDPAVVETYRSDPMVYHGKLPVRTVSELARAVSSFPTAVAAITIPTLLMYGTEDKLCPPQGSVMLSERIGSSDLTTKAYPGLYHEILNEPEQDEVLDDLCGWLRLRAGALAA
jgi:alpha-beta hydrolase superfamily lysophospholipase